MKNPKDISLFEQDIACAVCEYAYENNEYDIECLVRVRSTNQGSEAEVANVFTLSAEEVEIVERGLIAIYDIFDTDVERGIYPISDELKREMEEVKLLLTRIKQLQNENRTD